MEEKRGTSALAVILICVLAALIAAGAFYYKNVYVPGIEEAAQASTSYSAGTTTPQKTGQRELIAENGDAAVYRDGDYIIVSYGGTEAEFSNWSANFGITDTEIYLTDFDDNGTGDIIILDDEGEDETSSLRLYGLYILCSEEDGDGYAVYYTNADSWQSYFNGIVTCYLNQPEAYPGILQFVMELNGTDVPYDTETGLATSDRAYYTSILTDEDGSYVEMSTIRLSPAFISYNEETQSVETQIHVYAVYENSEEQDIGIIMGGISIYDAELSISSESVLFEVNEELAVSAPE